MTALAEMVRAGDPDRHAATLAAPEAARARLWPLYAFNLEIARAPYVTQEPMIAEMRLQFWADTLNEIAAGKPPRAHEVAQPLAGLWREAGLPVALGLDMVAARRWDIYRDPFDDLQALRAHLQATSGHLMWLAALVLGAAPETEPVIRDMGFAQGLANWLRAVPAMEARGRHPLPVRDPAALHALAQEGLDALGRARQARGRVPDALAPVLLAGWQAGPVLRRAARAPERILDGGLELSEFARRGRLLLRALSGRW